MQPELKRKLSRMRLHPDLIREASESGITEYGGDVAIADMTKINRYLLRRFVWCLNAKGRMDDNLDKAFPPGETRSQTFFRGRAMDIVAKDPTMMTMIQTVAAYFRHRGKKYLVQKDFFDMFKKVNTEKLNFSHLPEGAGFVKMPHPISDGEDNFSWFYWYVGDRDEFIGLDKMYPEEIVMMEENEIKNHGHTLRGKWASYLAYMDEKEGITAQSMRVFDKGSTEPLKEAYRNVRTIYRLDVDTDHTYTEAEAYHSHISLMYALLVYLKSGTPDLREFRRQPDQRPRSGQKKGTTVAEITNPDLVLVGFNYKKGPAYKPGSTWYVPPFYAFRWCGIGKKDVRLTEISGSTRRRRKVPEKGNIDGKESNQLGDKVSAEGTSPDFQTVLPKAGVDLPHLQGDGDRG